MARKQQSAPSYGPPLPPSHLLVQLGAPQGSSNYLCVDNEGEERLVEVSKALRRVKTLFIMRGDFAVVNLFPTQSDEKSRLVGEVVHVLDRGDVKEWKKSGEWPQGLGEQPAPPPAQESGSENESGEEDEDEVPGSD